MGNACCNDDDNNISTSTGDGGYYSSVTASRRDPNKHKRPPDPMLTKEEQLLQQQQQNQNTTVNSSGKKDAVSSSLGSKNNNNDENNNNKDHHQIIGINNSNVNSSEAMYRSGIKKSPRSQQQQQQQQDQDNDFLGMRSPQQADEENGKMLDGRKKSVFDENWQKKRAANGDGDMKRETHLPGANYGVNDFGKLTTENSLNPTSPASTQNRKTWGASVPDEKTPEQGCLSYEEQDLNPAGSETYQNLDLADGGAGVGARNSVHSGDANLHHHHNPTSYVLSGATRFSSSVNNSNTKENIHTHIHHTTHNNVSDLNDGILLSDGAGGGGIPNVPLGLQGGLFSSTTHAAHRNSLSTTDGTATPTNAAANSPQSEGKYTLGHGMGNINNQNNALNAAFVPVSGFVMLVNGTPKVVQR
jgi:hypothetical protein